MFDFPPVGGDEGSGDVVRELVGNRNYRRRPARGEGADRHARELNERRGPGRLQRLLARLRRSA